MRKLAVRRLGLAVAVATVGLAAGCSSADRNTAAPTRTETVIQTVTKAPPATPRPRPAAPIAPTYTTFTGSYFSVDYPDTWNFPASQFLRRRIESQVLDKGQQAD
jgi:hypothetical protein